MVTIGGKEPICIIVPMMEGTVYTLQHITCSSIHSDNHGLGIPTGLAGRVAGGAGAGLKFQPVTNPHL